MKQLTNVQTYIFLFGALMMVIGAGITMTADLPIIQEATTADLLHKLGACGFMLGAVCFAAMQMLQQYDGNDIAVRRLRTMQVTGDVCFILSGLLLVERAFRLLYPILAANEMHLFYVQYINNNWVVFLLIATMLEVYTTHRIAHIMRDDKE